MNDSPFLNGPPEPPAFPESQPNLRRLDAAVVCQICKELYDAPVVIACGHSFCSKCIRASLQSLKSCPVCEVKAKEGDIRRNRALEEVVQSWELARANLITLTLVPSRKATFFSNNAVASSSKRPSSDSPSRTESPRRSTSPRKKVKRDDNVIVVDSSDVEEIEELGEDDLTGCPLCGNMLPVSSIPAHIDRGCKDPVTKKQKGGKGTQASWKDLFAGSTSSRGRVPDMTKIIKPNYSMATPAELREILTEYGLPTQGDKPALTERVQEWILLFNSNLDTERPKSVQVLRTTLADHEAARKRDKERGRDDAVEDLASAEGLQRYAQAQRDPFAKLRADALKSVKAAKKAKLMAAKAEAEAATTLEPESLKEAENQEGR